MTLLVLAGTGEARRLCAALAGRDVIASLAGAVNKPADLGVPMRIGGFGGQAGFEAFLAEKGISAVIDATHPFASRITERTARVCAARGIAYLRLERPPWQPEPGDDWVMIADEGDAARHVSARDVVFLATGRQTLARFAGLGVAHVYCRQIDPPSGPFPFAGGEYVIGRPPFSIADEVALFTKLGITRLVVKNAGGDLSKSKLDAARALGIKVLMIERPPEPDCERVETVEAALDWANLRLKDGI